MGLLPRHLLKYKACWSSGSTILVAVAGLLRAMRGGVAGYGWLISPASAEKWQIVGGLWLRRSAAWHGLTAGRTKSRTVAGWSWLKNNPNQLGTWGLQVLMVGTLALFYLAGVWWLSLAGLVLFLPFAWVFPNTALGLAVATAPLLFHPHNFRTEANPLEFSLNEVVIVETALVWAAQAIWGVVRGRRYSFMNRRLTVQLLISEKSVPKACCNLFGRKGRLCCR